MSRLDKCTTCGFSQKTAKLKMTTDKFEISTNKLEHFYLQLTHYQKKKKFKSKLKELAEHKINVTEKLKFVLGRIENVGKEEIAGYQHFLFFLQCFQKAYFPESLKVRSVWQRVKLFITEKDFSHWNQIIKLLRIQSFDVTFVSGFTPYQQYFSFLTATVHKSMFPGLFLTST